VSSCLLAKIALLYSHWGLQIVQRILLQNSLYVCDWLSLGHCWFFSTLFGIISPLWDFFFGNMLSNKGIITNWFYGKNYFFWEFHLQNFIQGKELRGYIDRTKTKPVGLKDQAQWISNNARVISWILGLVESDITLNLLPIQLLLPCATI
jgi:hypothetical protein